MLPYYQHISQSWTPVFVVNAEMPRRHANIKGRNVIYTFSQLLGPSIVQFDSLYSKLLTPQFLIFRSGRPWNLRTSLKMRLRNSRQQFQTLKKLKVITFFRTWESSKRRENRSWRRTRDHGRRRRRRHRGKSTRQRRRSRRCWGSQTDLVERRGIRRSGSGIKFKITCDLFKPKYICWVELNFDTGWGKWSRTWVGPPSRLGSR